MHSCGRAGRVACAAALGLFALAATPSTAHAQLPTPRSLEVTPFLGFTFGTNQEGPTTALGAGVTYHWTDQIAFEGELGIVPDIEGDVSSTDIGMLTLSANGVYHFDTGSPYVPYGTFGLGIGRTSYDFDDLPDFSDTELAFNLGGGVKKAINDKLSWRADLRYFNVNDDNPNFWRVYGGVIFHFRR